MPRLPRASSLTHYDLRAILGDDCLHGWQKRIVIDQLAASEYPPPTRRKIYRQWCAATMTKVHREDLNDVAPPASKPKQMLLWSKEWRRRRITTRS